MTQTQQSSPQAYKTVFVSKENDVNKILRDQRRNKTKIKILLTSIWERQNDICLDLREKLAEKEDNKVPLFVLDSYSVPHSFVIFKVTKVPTLVTLNREKIFVQDYVPTIYKELGI